MRSATTTCMYRPIILIIMRVRPVVYDIGIAPFTSQISVQPTFLFPKGQYHHRNTVISTIALLHSLSRQAQAYN